MSFAADIQDKAFGYLQSADKELEKYPVLKKIESQSGVPKAYGVIGFVFVYFFFVFFNFGGIGQLFANFASLVIPGYYSLKALESKSTADDTHFLTYWVVFATFSVLEFWSNTILYWIPFYWVFKTVFFLYIGLPQFGGCRFIYLNVLRPFSVKVLGITGGSAAVSVPVEKVSENLKEQVEEAVDAASSTSVEY